jgi:hypothetical protein
MRDKLPRIVIRFTERRAIREEPGTGANMGDNYERPRCGHLITIPTAEENAARAKRGMPLRKYTPHPDDVPAARFMFAVLCDDQVNGSRGDKYPPPLEDTGLVWPDKIEADDLLK